MKENRYDDEVFFQKYGEMTRSKKGLQGAGEWHALRKILPDFSGKRVLDLGCGYGWHCKYAVSQGADYVLGTDISHKMLEAARRKNADEKIEYQCAAMEDLKLPEESFDFVFSSLAFHYVRDFNALAEKVRGWLKPGGDFVFSVEHPVFTAYGSQGWYYDENGEILHFPVDNYYYEGKRDAVFLGERITKYHRTVTAYLETLLQMGFELRHVIEPQPPEDMMDLEGMKDEMRRPMMLLVAAVKAEKSKREAGCEK
ncbi:MAG TPA: class I SAM-dependent methyltransferase [Candidatus Choladousia intestinavium]|uniref:Class I SAM-dependent methyltransferase n=1 Tax=Candidatus Choladousia intestinavium TaxID=2840727 RepID=A0A9D1AB98_9FIRM|nr:class I SAM-dependent methyltransferase [Candidatus Choladousia intestinavium]